ncbi:MAG: hypothetical protein M1814_005649 [Vezdaea aestivalis]|nr:MAG: hypothetical protein M1814_005649 [Vezdaea aestivalis]
MSLPPHSATHGSIPPLLQNEPPQIFGALDQNGLPIPPSLSEAIFTNDTEYEDHQDGGDPKRRRIARACDMCRKKKIKCDGKMPACSHCLNYKTECIFTHVEKKRNPPKGAKYIEGLENRLGRMESLLRLSGLINDEDGTETDLGTLERRLADKSPPPPGSSTRSDSVAHTLTHTPPASSVTSPALDAHLSPPKSTSSRIASPEVPKNGTKEGEEEVEALSDMMCSLVTNNCGETRYLGSSSGFSIFSPKGIQWVNEKTGDSSFQEMITQASVEDSRLSYWKPEVFEDLFSHKKYKSLPPKAEAMSLLRDYFENFNCMFPLFHEPTFMHLVERHYSKDPYQGSGWWASFNVALAIAHRLRVMSNLVPHEEDEKAWGYLKNALGVLTELTMRNTDLLSVQALLGMALFLQGTPNPQPSFFLVSAAIRLSHSIGLHKRGSGFNLNPEESEQRKRVFWIAYMLDKDLCLRSGRPTAQDDNDFNVELPSADPKDNIGNIPLADGKSKINLFRLMATFALIESKVYKLLYSTKASKQSDGELLNTIGELDAELEEWKDDIPIDFRPEYEIQATHTPLMLHIVVLHFSYYNCLTTIHRMSVHHGYWTNRLVDYAVQGLNARPLNPRVFTSAQVCVTAARASINLIKYIPQGDFACVWMILYFPVSALVTLFANILQNPQDPRARQDIRLMNIVVNFLGTLTRSQENGSIAKMLNVCTEFERIAKIVLEKSDKESSSRRKRKSQLDSELAAKGQAPATTSVPRNASNLNVPGMSPPTNGDTNGLNVAFPSPMSGFSPSPSGEFNWMSSEFGAPGGTAAMSPPNGLSFSDVPGQIPTSGAGFLGASPGANPNTFQNPFVPQDLWQMPMTIEWDWADMTMGSMPGFGMEGQQPQ